MSGVDADNRVAQAVVAPQPQRGASPPIGLEEFCREHYRKLVAITMYVGATKEEAQEAAAGAIADLVGAWGRPDDPLKWARRAAINHFYKEKTPGPERDRNRLVEKGAATAEGDDHQQLLLWEDRHWVDQMLEPLPQKQKEAMKLVTEGYTPKDIATLLGRTPEAVRQNLLEARRRLRREMQQEPAGEQQLGSTARSSRKKAR
jgi:RNA polymerase sigma factor (sigma-70 family)